MKACVIPLTQGHGVIEYGGIEVAFVGATAYATKEHLWIGFDSLDRPLYGTEQIVQIHTITKTYVVPRGVPSDDIIYMLWDQWPLQGFLDSYPDE